MVAYKIVTLPRFVRGTVNYVNFWSVVGYHIKVGGRELILAFADVARHSERLEKYLGQNHCRTDVGYYAAFVYFGADVGEDAEVNVRRLTQLRSVEGRLLRDDVSSDTDVYGDRESHFVGSSKDR